MCSVTFESASSDGIDFKITILKTGVDTANIAITSKESGVEHTDTYNVFSVTANATTIYCATTVLWWHPTLKCTIDSTRPPGAATVRITVANAPAHNGPTDYKVSAIDARKIAQFLAAAAFPPLGP